MDLFLFERFHCSKTEYMSDKLEGISIVEQMLRCYQTQVNDSQSKMKDDLYQILEYIEKNKKFMMFHLQQIKECDSYSDAVDGLIEFVCEQCGITDNASEIQFQIAEEFPKNIDFVALREIIENVIDECEGPEFTKNHITQNLNKIRRQTYISSWTQHEKINMLMWESYSKELYGISIKTKCSKLEKAITNKQGYQRVEAFIEKVEYKDNPMEFIKKGFDEDLNEYEKIDSNKPQFKQFRLFAKHSLRFKREAYRSEEEARVILVDDKGDLDGDANFYFEIDSNFIDEIHLNPRLGASRVEDYVAIINELCKKKFNRKYAIFHGEKCVQKID